MSDEPMRLSPAHAKTTREYDGKHKDNVGNSIKLGDFVLSISRSGHISRRRVEAFTKHSAGYVGVKNYYKEDSKGRMLRDPKTQNWIIEKTAPYVSDKGHVAINWLTHATLVVIARANGELVNVNTKNYGELHLESTQEIEDTPVWAT
jgi:hypothetical protein